MSGGCGGHTPYRAALVMAEERVYPWRICGPLSWLASHQRMGMRPELMARLRYLTVAVYQPVALITPTEVTPQPAGPSGYRNTGAYISMLRR